MMGKLFPLFCPQSFCKPQQVTNFINVRRGEARCGWSSTSHTPEQWQDVSCSKPEFGINVTQNRGVIA